MKKIIKSLLKKLGINISRIDLNSPDQLVTRKINGFPMLLNRGHIYNSLFLFENYDKNLSRLVKEIYRKYPNMRLVDVGANIGDSVAVIRSMTDVPIICIEGDEKYHSLLVENLKQFKNVDIIHAFLGDHSEEINAKLVSTNGTLKIDLESKQDVISLTTLDELAVRDAILFSNIRVIKIDTDGFDGKVIRGAESLVDDQKPVIFFEYSESHLREVGDDGLSIFKFLEDKGYCYIMFFDLYGRFILSTEISEKQLIEQMHNYISNYGQPIYYLDIAIFHEKDKDIFDSLVQSESSLNKESSNKTRYNR